MFKKFGKFKKFTKVNKDFKILGKFDDRLII